jgi:hypothetical protein
VKGERGWGWRHTLHFNSIFDFLCLLKTSLQVKSGPVLSPPSYFLPRKLLGETAVRAKSFFCRVPNSCNFQPQLTTAGLPVATNWFISWTFLCLLIIILARRMIQHFLHATVNIYYYRYLYWIVDELFQKGTFGLANDVNKKNVLKKHFTLFFFYTRKYYKFENCFFPLDAWAGRQSMCSVTWPFSHMREELQLKGSPTCWMPTNQQRKHEALYGQLVSSVPGPGPNIFGLILFRTFSPGSSSRSGTQVTKIAYW